MKSFKLLLLLIIITIIHLKNKTVFSFDTNEQLSLSKLYHLSEKIDKIKFKCHQNFDNIINEIINNLNLYEINAYGERISYYIENSKNLLKIFQNELKLFYQKIQNLNENYLKYFQNSILKEYLIKLQNQNIYNELNDYYDEYDYINSIFNETIDETSYYLEFLLNRSIIILFHSNDNYQNVFFTRKNIFNTDINNNNNNWNNLIINKNYFNNGQLCIDLFQKFTKEFINQTFQCLIDLIPWIYNIYYTNKEESLSILKLMKIRIEQIENCIKFNNYFYSCSSFVKNNENDLKIIYDKIIDLQFYNVQQKIRIPKRKECIPHTCCDLKIYGILKRCLEF